MLTLAALVKLEKSVFFLERVATNPFGRVRTGKQKMVRKMTKELGHKDQ